MLKPYCCCHWQYQGAVNPSRDIRKIARYKLFAKTAQLVIFRPPVIWVDIFHGNLFSLFQSFFGKQNDNKFNFFFW